MKNFFKNNYLLIPAVVVVLFLSVLFNSQYAKFDSLASILSAQQLLAKHQSSYQALSYAQKVDLISEIDKESNLLAVEYRDLNNELETLNQEKESKQSEYNSANQQLVSVNSQFAVYNARLNSLKSRIQNLNENYREKSRQCNQLKGTQAQNCRNQLKNISDNITNVRNQITTTQQEINNLRISISSNQIEVNANNVELRSLSQKIILKQNEVNKVKQLLSNLAAFRVEVVNSTSDPNNPNPEKPGCMDINATNWDSSATEDDGSCQYKGDARGCTDSAASNYDPEATEDDGSCYYPTPCECEKETDPTTGEQKEVENVMEITAHVTHFGGPDDTVMGRKETLSVSGGYARDLNPNDLYIAWPMPDMETTDGTNEDFNPPLGLPSVEKCFGSETNSWPKGEGDERIAEANKALRNYNAELSMVGADGVRRTVVAKIVDRGPDDRNRFDVSKGVQRGLGMPQDGTYTFEVKLVPINGNKCSDES